MSENTQAITLTKEQQAAVAEARKLEIKAKFNNLVDVQETKFFFKTVEDKDLGTKTRRPTVELMIPVPSIEGIVAILESGDEKQQRLLLEAVAEIPIARARDWLNDNEGATEKDFPMDILSWEEISKIPPKERRGSGIAKETWEAFALDYCAVMPAVTGKTPEQVAKASKLLVTKFQSVKTVKKVITMLVQQLGIYINATARGEEFAECVQFLQEKAEVLLASNEDDLLANL